MMGLIERLESVAETGCDPDLPHEAAEEIRRLRVALERLESACDARAALLTQEAYLSAEKAPGMGEAMEELDDARRHARQLLDTPK